VSFEVSSPLPDHIRVGRNAEPLLVRGHLPLPEAHLDRFPVQAARWANPTFDPREEVLAPTTVVSPHTISRQRESVLREPPRGSRRSTRALTSCASSRR